MVSLWPSLGTHRNDLVVFGEVDLIAALLKLLAHLQRPVCRPRRAWPVALAPAVLELDQANRLRQRKQRAHLAVGVELD